MLTNIQLLRFLAALSIVFYHAVPVFRLQDRGSLFEWVQFVGFSGVDVFFVISGFIMWYTTHERNGRAFALGFLKRRLARIYTGYWPYLLIAVLIFLIFEPGVLSRKSVTGSRLPLWAFCRSVFAG